MPRQPVPAGSSWEPVAQQLLSVFPTGPPTRAARHGEGAPIHHVKSSQVKSKRKELKLESIGTLRKKEGQASSAVHVLFTSVSAKINSGAKTWTHTCPLSVCVWKCSYEVPMNIYTQKASTKCCGRPGHDQFTIVYDGCHAAGTFGAPRGALRLCFGKPHLR